MEDEAARHSADSRSVGTEAVLAFKKCWRRSCGAGSTPRQFWHSVMLRSDGIERSVSRNPGHGYDGFSEPPSCYPPFSFVFACHLPSVFRHRPSSVHAASTTQHASSIDHPPSCMHHPSAIHHSPSTTHHPPSVIQHASCIHRPSYTIRHPAYINIIHPSSTIRHPPLTINHRSSIIHPSSLTQPAVEHTQFTIHHPPSSTS